ncbi:recombinase family protein [Microbacterium sp. AZCO]|uniref:recombinase family protein n=1 Tax=Microbacterium sp. AZCO TaxID=3142976 RepID=UPI0031F3731F
MGKVQLKKAPEGPKIAAIYTRISQDRDNDEDGVKRQEKDCRKLAKRLGYEVPEPFVFRENDVSASTRSKQPRPLYDAMLDAARNGEIQAIVAYSTSRITRRVRELLDLIDLVEKHGTQIHTLQSGDVNVNTADGRGVAITLAAWDAAEAERLGERVARAKAQAVDEGRYRGGRRPYGFQKDGVTIVPHEAEVIVWATNSILEGRSIRALVAELNAKGEKSTSGKKWATNAFRDMVLRPRNAGLISTGQRSHGNFKIRGKAVWPPIVSKKTFKAVEDKLTDPGRRTNPGRYLPSWLGSGVYRCGVVDEHGAECGGMLRVSKKGGTEADPSPERWFYRCPEKAHLAIAQVKLDKYVRDEVADLVNDPDIRAALTPKGVDLAPDREALAILNQRLKRTDRDYDNDLIDGQRHKVKTAKLTADIAVIEKRMAQATQRSTSSPILGARDPGQAFLDAPVDIQRAVIAAVVRVTVVQSRVEDRGKRLTDDLLRARVRIEPAARTEEADAA